MVLIVENLREKTFINLTYGMEFSSRNKTYGLFCLYKIYGCNAELKVTKAVDCS